MDKSTLIFVHNSLMRQLIIIKKIFKNQNYWVFGLCPSSVFEKLDNTTFRKLDLFASSGEGETPTLFGPLLRANLNHRVGVSP
jgi:hypothetical protein